MRACANMCGGGSVMVFKGLEPSFSGNHGDRTLRTTGREETGWGCWGGIEGETERIMGTGVGVCIL